MPTSPMGKLRGLLGGATRAEPGARARTSGLDPGMARQMLEQFEQAGSGWFWSTDPQGAITYISAQLALRLGVEAGEFSGRPFIDLFVSDPDGEDTQERSLPLMLRGHKTFSEVAVRAADVREELWWSITGRPQFSPAGQFTGYFGSGSDITAQRRDQIVTSRLALVDPLTGLANRRQMENRLESVLRQSAGAGRTCALLMMDLDRFKQVNDTLGHPAGDSLLRQVAARIGKAIPVDHRIGRLGGDEFQIMIPDMSDRGDLGAIATRIIDIVSQPYTIEESRCRIGASVGVAVAPFDGAEVASLMRNADLALYAAKRGGRGQFRFYGAELSADAQRRKQIEEDLRHALARGEVSVVYRPRIEVTTNKVVALEADFRWEHPDLGDISPDIFMPIAEESGQLAALEEWSLRQACDDVVQLPGNVRVAVRVSAAFLGNVKMVDVATQALAHSELAPERLELELREDSLELAREQLGDLFADLKIMGIGLSLRQYGAGRSSLATLRHCPFERLGIADLFTEGLVEEDGHDLAVARAIVGMAKALGMEVAASGIEAQDQLTAARELGVGEVQGPLFAGAVPFAEVVDAMASGAWVIEPNGPSRFRSERRTVFRRVGVVHEDFRYEVMMRNLSRSGCMLDGLLAVPVGTQFVVDFGDGQLAVGTVRRSAGSMVALEFELPLVDDGAGGLVTRNRVSRQAMLAAGLVAVGEGGAAHPVRLSGGAGQLLAMPRFAQVGETRA